MGAKLTAEGEMYLSTPIPAGWRSCDICGHEGLDVLPGVGAYPNPATPGGLDYARVTRCRKAAECRTRCEAVGNQWPLA